MARRSRPATAPFAVGDLVVQHQHLLHEGVVAGPAEDLVDTVWRVLAVTEDAVTLRLHAGRYVYVGDEPFQWPGYQSDFTSSDLYRARFPGRPGNAQILEEWVRVEG